MSLLTTAQAAEQLGLTQRFMESRRSKGTGPKYIRISATCVRYRQEDLDAWLEERMVHTTGANNE